jgi:alkylation response protein AidB-like acyl-CoA dehydrogenase
MLPICISTCPTVRRARFRQQHQPLQIHGGMGLMEVLPLERIWDGTSEVQRHIISRLLLRPLGG